MFFVVFFFKQKTAYEMRISDWSSDVCSSDLVAKDPIGNFYFQDLQDNGVDSNLQHQDREDGITGKCLVLITPDAERTMNTFLGITSSIEIGRASCRERVCQYV